MSPFKFQIVSIFLSVVLSLLPFYPFLLQGYKCPKYTHWNFTSNMLSFPVLILNSSSTILAQIELHMTLSDL